MMKIRDNFNRILESLKRNKFIANAGAYVSSNFLLQAAGFLLTPLWARYLTPKDYGITGTIAAYSGVISSLLMMGIDVPPKN